MRTYLGDLEVFRPQRFDNVLFGLGWLRRSKAVEHASEFDNFGHGWRWPRAAAAAAPNLRMTRRLSTRAERTKSRDSCRIVSCRRLGPVAAAAAAAERKTTVCVRGWRRLITTSDDDNMFVATAYAVAVAFRWTAEPSPRAYAKQTKRNKQNADFVLAHRITE